MTPPERKGCRSLLAISWQAGWGCLQIGTELSRLFLPIKRVELSFGRYDAGVIELPSTFIDGIFYSPLLPNYQKECIQCSHYNKNNPKRKV
jgi:hypothetical protein